ESARRGVIAGEVGMVLAIVGTLIRPADADFHYQWIIVTILVGTAIGIPIALLMPMTAVPQRTALSHSFGGLAVGLVGTAEYYLNLQHGRLPHADSALNLHLAMGILAFGLLLGFLTFTGSLMAFG